MFTSVEHTKECSLKTTRCKKKMVVISLRMTMDVAR